MTHHHLNEVSSTGSDSSHNSDISEIAKQIELRLTNWGLRYETNTDYMDEYRFYVVDVYKHIWIIWLLKLTCLFNKLALIVVCSFIVLTVLFLTIESLYNNK